MFQTQGSAYLRIDLKWLANFGFLKVILSWSVDHLLGVLLLFKIILINSLHKIRRKNKKVLDFVNS